MPSTDEVNAAFDVIHADLLRLINAKAPFFFKGQIMSVFDSAEGRHTLVDTIHDGLVAAEKVRAKKP